MTTTEILENYSLGQNIKDLTFDKQILWDFHGHTLDNPIKSLVFERCRFTEKMELRNLNGKTPIVFRNCHFEKDEQRFKSLVLFGLKFENCSFKNLSIIDSDLINLTFHNCESIEEFIQIRSVKGAECLIEWDDESKKASFGIWCPEIEKIRIKSRNNVENLSILDVKSLFFEGSVNDTLNIPAKTFDSISIQPYTPTIIDAPRLIYDKIDSLRITNHSFSGTVKIKEIKIESLFFNNIECTEGAVNLIDLKIETATFMDVNIKSFYWNQVRFIRFLKIERCDLTNLKMADVDWLKGHKVSSSHIDMSKRQIRRHSQLKALQYERETYRQLKAASIANHNDVEALDFYRNEMRLFWKQIRINGGVSKWDRILVFLNRWVSDFGQNWILPLMWLFVFHTLVYFSIIGFNFSDNPEAFKSGTGQYFELLNPVHRTPEYITGFNIGLELLLRVLDGFFIYHFVRATRKFAKG